MNDHKKSIIVRIWLKETSQPLEYDAENAYQKGDFYCIYILDAGLVHKYPIANVWRIEEEYGQ